MTRQLKITVDDDFAALLDEEMRRTGASIDEIFNTALRRGLRMANARLELPDEAKEDNPTSR